jgi:hypothetical protein
VTLIEATKLLVEHGGTIRRQRWSVEVKGKPVRLALLQVHGNVIVWVASAAAWAPFATDILAGDWEHTPARAEAAA